MFPHKVELRTSSMKLEEMFKLVRLFSTDTLNCNNKLNSAEPPAPPLLAFRHPSTPYHSSFRSNHNAYPKRHTAADKRKRRKEETAERRRWRSRGRWKERDEVEMCASRRLGKEEFQITNFFIISFRSKFALLVGRPNSIWFLVVAVFLLSDSRGAAAMVRAILIRCRSFCSLSSQYSSASAANQTNPRGKLSSLFQLESVKSVVGVNQAISFFDAMISSQIPNSIRQRNKLLAIVIQNRRYYDATQMYRKLEVIQSNINTINMLVNCYSKVSCIDYGFGMLSLILKRGLSPDVIFFNTLVKGLCLEKRVEEAGWLLCKMEEIGCSPDEVMWQTFYRGLCSLGDLDLAVHLCHKLAGTLYADSAIVMQLISVCHGVAIHYLIEKGSIVKAEQLMVEMRQHGILPYLFAYHTIIYFWCCAHEMEKAINMLSEMKYYGIFPTIVTYNMIIHGFCRAGQVEEALCKVHEMKNSALYPNVVTYNCLIHGLCRAGQFEEAWHMFTEMKTRGPVPNVVTYNCLIHGLCRAGELEEAWHMFTEMKTRRPYPDVVTYNCLIHGLCRAGELKEAWHMFTEMKTRGPDLNVVTYNCLIDGLCRAAQFEEVWHMFTEMKTRGPDPNVVTYTCLIHGLCRAGELKEAWHMFTEMKTRGPNPDVVTYNCLIHGLCRVGQFEEAWHMFTEMKTRGPNPNVVTYNCLIHGLCRAGELKEAWHMFTEMKTRGPDPNVVTYSSIINGFCRVGRVGRAQRLFHEMKTDGVSPDEYTYNSIIGGLCKVGDWKATNLIFTQMLEQRVKPNYITLDVVRNARLQKSNRNDETQILYLESAIEDQIVTATERSRRSFTRDRMGIGPDVIFFTTLVKGLYLEKRVEEAGWLLCRMAEIGCSPDELLSFRTRIVLANRLKTILPSIISDSQSAFIPGRLISDNILAAHELIHFMKTRERQRAGYYALKLDMTKAYDRVECDFLEAMHRRMGFPDQWTEMIMACVKSVSYMIRINDAVTEEIRPERGLRQGDPLSPYLFLFCTEWFAQKLRQGQERRDLRGIKICRDAPEVTHLLFADDSIIFLRACRNDVDHLKRILRLFEEISGQKINLAKSEICFSKNVAPESMEEICDILEMRHVNSFSKYLGLPVTFSNNKTEIFKFIVERMWQKVQGWKEKTLSMAGKEILIKSILQAIPTYAMMCYKMPASLIKKIVGIISRYWWSNKEGDRCIYWGSYKLLSKAKEVGGLGMRDFESFNDALLAKQVWRLLSNQETLVSRMLKAKYFKEGDAIHSQLGHRPSFAWRSIWNVTNKVGQWISLEGTLQKPVWKGHDSGEFSVRSAYSLLKSLSELPQTNLKGEQASYDRTHAFWRRIWRLNVQPKVKLFAWRLYHNFLPSADNLTKKQCLTERECQICGWKRETTIHTVLQCWWAKAFWESSRFNHDFSTCTFSYPGDWLWYCVSNFPDQELAFILNGAMQIWFNRNLVVTGKRNLNPFTEAAAMEEAVLWSQRPEHSFVVTSLVGEGKWKPPEKDFVKINVDGAWDRETGKAGIGLCCRVETGVWLFVEAEPVRQLGSSFEVELCSLARSLEAAEERNLKRVVFELDSAEVFNAIQKRTSWVGSAAGRLTRIRHLLGRNPLWFLSLILREANSEADKLARKAKGGNWSWRNPDAIPLGFV
ncbi:unnamed protein product [Rhodiola kirilowii]